jgi:hypothetical protein
LALANSLSVVPSTTYFDAQPQNYIVNVAITGATVGQKLQRVFKNNGGTVLETWYNIDNSPATIITAPTSTNLLNNDIVLLNNTQLSDKRPVNKWYLTHTTYVGGSSNTVFAIRNTNTFPVRISSFELSANTNVTTAQAINIPWVASIGTGTTTIT